jgi:hypothetical protein
MGTTLAWSMGTLAARWPAVRASELPLAEAFLWVTLGALATVATAWLGIGAVAWAMIRLLRGRAPLGEVLKVLAASAVPLWAAAPAVAFLMTDRVTASGGVFLMAIVAAATLAFAALTATGLRTAVQFSPMRAWASVGLTAAFCLSFLSLHL